MSDTMDELRAAVAAFWEAWSDADFELGMSFYEDHPEFNFASDSALWPTQAAVAEAFREPFAKVASQEFVWEQTLVSMPSPGMGYVAQRGEFVQVAQDGARSDSQPVVFTTLWAKGVDGAWKVRAGHHSGPGLTSID